jgi:hypothetical protein
MKNVDYFNIIGFGFSQLKFREDCTLASEDNIKQAIKFIRDMPVITGTNHTSVIEEAFLSRFF